MGKMSHGCLEPDSDSYVGLIAFQRRIRHVRREFPVQNF